MKRASVLKKLSEEMAEVEGQISEHELQLLKKQDERACCQEAMSTVNTLNQDGYA